MRIFGGERMQNLMLRLGMEEDVPIESKLITKRIAAAQKAVEAQNFEARKHLLEYDDVMNKQRQAVYGMRRKLLEGDDQKERILEIMRGHPGRVHRHALPGEDASRSTWDLDQPARPTSSPSSASRSTPQELPALDRREIEDDDLRAAAEEVSGEGRHCSGAELMRETERMIMLQRHRQPVEGPPAVDGPPEGRHRHCAATARRIRWSSTRRNPTSCSRT